MQYEGWEGCKKTTPSLNGYLPLLTPPLKGRLKQYNPRGCVKGFIVGGFR